MPATPNLPPVTVSVREDDRNEAHVHLSVFVGRNPGARGRSGTLVLRTDEWDELRRVLAQREGDNEAEAWYEPGAEYVPLFTVTPLPVLHPGGEA